MCQSVPEGYDSQVLTPHDYPLWVKLFAGFAAVLVIASFVKLPGFLNAAIQLKKSDQQFDQKNYAESAQIALQVLKENPDAQKVRLKAAKALFSENTDDSVNQAMDLLKGQKLDKYDWKELAPAMSPSVQKQFKTIKEDD
ncbi:MAG TPA: hypothetical protein V6C89_18030 [Drouetiella sp.]